MGRCALIKNDIVPLSPIASAVVWACLIFPVVFSSGDSNPLLLPAIVIATIAFALKLLQEYRCDGVVLKYAAAMFVLALIQLAVRILGTEEELLPALCTAAEAGLRARLRRDVDPEKALAVSWFGSEKALLKFDMSEYQEQHTAARLLGAPPGYLGHDEGAFSPLTMMRSFRRSTM